MIASISIFDEFEDITGQNFYNHGKTVGEFLKVFYSEEDNENTANARMWLQQILLLLDKVVVIFTKWLHQQIKNIIFYQKVDSMLKYNSFRYY